MFINKIQLTLSISAWHGWLSIIKGVKWVLVARLSIAIELNMIDRLKTTNVMAVSQLQCIPLNVICTIFATYM